MRVSAGRWRRRVLVALAVAGLALGAGGTPVQAHPFGDPQTVAIEADGEVVRVEWRVGGMDDLTLLGIDLGVLPPDRVMLDGAITFEDGDAETVAGSEEFRGYLLDRIAVASDGADCAGEVVEVGDLAEESARLEFACAGPVTTARVTVRVLTDLHPDYRTLATGPDGQRAVYENAANSHEWSLDSGAVAARDAAEPASASVEEGVGRSAALQLGAVGGAALLIFVAGALALRRHSHRHPTSHTT